MSYIIMFFKVHHLQLPIRILNRCLNQLGSETVVSLCLYQGWGQVIIWLFVATSRFNGAHLLNFGFEKVLELKDSIFKLILKPQHPNSGSDQDRFRQIQYSLNLFGRQAHCPLYQFTIFWIGGENFDLNFIGHKLINDFGCFGNKLVLL